MDIIPLNKSYYTDTIDKVPDNHFITFECEKHYDIKQIQICYCVYNSQTCKDIFNISNLNDIKNLLVKWYNGLDCGYDGRAGYTGNLIFSYI